jgi:3-phosphoshikimate 1-carboxyvinyltransferase
MKPLLDSLARLGAEIIDSADGHLPVTIKGPLKGGRTAVDGTTSQYLSSLLVHTPLCSDRTELTLEFLNEKPYVDMTLNWLKKLGIKFEKEGYSRFIIYPGQKIGAFKTAIPADFSSATFFLALAAVEGAEVELRGLDMEDVQGDKKVIDHLLSMGAEIEVSDTLKVIGKKLTGRTIDLNSTPDALPAMAVVGCLAEGETRLVNVPQARLKETDRIAVMAAELKKMGADIEEKPDGLVIRHSTLTGTKVDGHHDHRVVMSLALAGLAADGVTEISTAESISVTFPDFVELMRSCGAKMHLE